MTCMPTGGTAWATAKHTVSRDRNGAYVVELAFVKDCQKLRRILYSRFLLPLLTSAPTWL